MKTTDEIHRRVVRNIGNFLRHKFPADTAKHIARKFSTSHRTAEGWLQGQHPHPKMMTAFYVEWGEEFLNWVYPAINRGDSADHLLMELERVQTRISALLEIVSEENNHKRVPRNGTDQLVFRELF